MHSFDVAADRVLFAQNSQLGPTPPQHTFPGSCEMQLTWIQPRAEELLPVQPTQSQVLSTCCIRNKWKSLILQIRAQRLREVKL